ncbi:MAG TPA: phosphodiester glycosidase family protein [Clostridiaceae bacterium]|nr:phosphodiester glycosidase family protein [Clostridiaceae bacterium]
MNDKKAKNNGKIYAGIILISLVLLYAGVFLFRKPDNVSESANISYDNLGQMEDTGGNHDSKDYQDPIKYKHIKTEINGYEQEIHILEIDLSDDRVEVMPVLSYGKVYGFDLLSNMAREHNAYAAVNAGFFHKYGQPSGMVVLRGKMYTGSTGKYPVLVTSGGTAYLKEIQTEYFIEYNNRRFYIDNINQPAKNGEIVLYTPEYGSSNRLDKDNLTAVIQKGRVKEISRMSGECSIPDDGMLLSAVLPAGKDENVFPFKVGDEVNFRYLPDLGKNAHAYECGSWIVKDGEIVIGERDEWVGVMTNRDPRTAVGVMDDGTLVFIVVDGRQPGFSAGLKGKELGEFILDYGIRNAAMLDGGASSEMIVKDKIVNRPSFKGQERPIAGAFIIKKETGDGSMSR